MRSLCWKTCENLVPWAGRDCFALLCTLIKSSAHQNHWEGKYFWLLCFLWWPFPKKFSWRWQAIRNEKDYPGANPLAQRHCAMDQRAVLVLKCHPPVAEDPRALSLPSPGSWSLFLRLLRWGLISSLPLSLWPNRKNLDENREKEHVAF